MSTLAYALLVTFAALATVTLAKVLSSAPRQSGLLSGTTEGPLELERIQSLLVTLGSIGIYGVIGASQLGSGAHTLPSVPVEVLGVLGISQFTFVAGKAYRRHRRQNS